MQRADAPYSLDTPYLPMDTLQDQTPRHRLHITSLAYGPHGVGRLDGKVIFVRGVVPDEEVEIAVREDHRSYAYADLQAVLRPGPARRLASNSTGRLNSCARTVKMNIAIPA